MSLINSTAIPSGATGYEIGHSVRFDKASNPRLTRTPSSEGNRKTWTYSVWLKRGNVGVNTYFLGSNGRYGTFLYFSGADRLGFNSSYADTGRGIESTALYRDPNAWMHIVAVFNTTESTGADRMKLYVNGSRLTDLSWNTAHQIPQNQDGMGMNMTTLQEISGGSRYPDTVRFDGYMAEINFIDGAAKAPSDFGETGDYGEWKPKAYSGSYGSKGFYLDFADSGNLGDDESGNGGDFAENNIAATDQMLDSPTNNFATWNPLDKFSANLVGTLSEGNLKIVDSVNHVVYRATTGHSSGKWYWEVYMISVGNPASCHTGICRTNTSSPNSATMPGDTGDAWTYNGNGNKFVGGGGGTSSYGASYTGGDIIGVALDLDNNTITFYKNNSSQGQLASGLTGEFTPLVEEGSHTSQFNTIANFGQDSSFAGVKTAQGNQDGNSIGDFYYTPPSGYLALCTKNFPDVAVVPSENFNPVLYTGNATARSITGVGFQPDFVWNKTRSANQNHFLYDAVRGASKDLRSNQTNAEGTSDAVTAFGSDGFSVGSGNDGNENNITYVNWNWKANGSSSSNTNGSINSTVSANTDAGFSIVSYTGNATSGATVGHGLSKAPQLILLKSRSAVTDFVVYSEAIGATKFLRLSSSVAPDTSSAVFNDTAPTSAVFSLGNNSDPNGGSETYIAYCFHSVDGYSKVGTYEGNSSTDGTFVYTGFRPALIICKSIDDSNHWEMLDNTRDVDNPVHHALQSNLSAAEDATNSRNDVDFLSNGFKFREDQSNIMNGSETYIYLAFAETPFKYSNAR